MSIKKSDILNRVFTTATNLRDKYRCSNISQLHIIAAFVELFIKNDSFADSPEVTKSLELLNFSEDLLSPLVTEIYKHLEQNPLTPYEEVSALEDCLGACDITCTFDNKDEVSTDILIENILSQLTETTNTVLLNGGWEGSKAAAKKADKPRYSYITNKDSGLYGEEVDFESMTLSDVVSPIKTLQSHLCERIYGQDEAISAIVSGYFNSLVGDYEYGRSKKPAATFLFAGAPGVGKTYLAQVAAKALHLPFRRFDMSSFSDKEATLEFSGSDRVYKASHEGLVTGFVKSHPRCVLLFDEIEKAHINIIHLFLQILDAGTLKDSHTGRNVSFKNAIIIMTTNAGKSLYENLEPGAPMPGRKVIVNALATETNPVTGQRFFPEAICSRFAAGNIVLFNPLGAQELLKICDSTIRQYSQNFISRFAIRLDFDENLCAALLFAEGGKADARTLKGRTTNFISSELYNWIKFAYERSANALNETEDITITVDASGETAELFEPQKIPYVLFYSENADAYSKIKSIEGYELLFANDKKCAEDFINNYDIAFAVCDIFGAAKFTLNIEDTASDGRKLMDTLINERVPTFVYCAFEHTINHEERQALLENGAYGFFEEEDEDNADVALDNICRRVHTEKTLRELARSRKVLSFDCVYNRDDSMNSGTIELVNLRIVPAIDAEDQKDVAGITATDTTFDSIVGAEDAKAELKGFMAYLKEPKAYARKGIPAPRGVILYGPPGTGKTMLAKALAHESGAAFIATQGNAFLSSKTGSGAAEVKRLFALARKYAPTVLFIDEIDIIAKDRITDGRADEVVNALLNEMDGFSTNPSRPVFVLAATNFDVAFGRKSALDPALLRRFDRRIFVDLPDKRDRLTFIKSRLEGCNQPLAEAVIQNIALRSTGMSLAELEAIIDFALRSMMQRGEISLTAEMLDEAFETYRYGEKTVWDESVLRRIAIHETGHALVSYTCGNKPLYITISGRSHFGGYSHFHMDDGPLRTKRQLLGDIRICLAGRAAELVFFGSEEGVSTGSESDLKRATQIALQMITVHGMVNEHGIMSNGEAPLGGDTARLCKELLDSELNNAIKLITKNKNAVERLVNALVEKNHLLGNEFEKILTKRDA